ncbi:MAG: hypothetical protein J0H09_22510 [Burkholderiales bacterium]|nr:hypothetical protein [Burkholderiales bacterium]
MTRNVFIVLLVIAILAVTLAINIAERYTAPGLGRTLMVAGITAAIMFPAGWIGERLGFIKGKFEYGKRARDAAARIQAEQRAKAEQQQAGSGNDDTRGDAK